MLLMESIPGLPDKVHRCMYVETQKMVVMDVGMVLTHSFALMVLFSLKGR